MKILIVDDQTLVRQGLKALLAMQPSCQVVGEAANGGEAIRQVDALGPDVVLMEVLMRESNGIEATRHLAARHPGSKVIALTGCRDRESARAMLGAGAAGYVLKSSDASELIEALRAVKAGKRFLSPAIAEHLLDDYIGSFGDSRPGSDTPGPSLSGREREVLQLLAEGFSTRAITDRLCISINTVETHRRHISEKLGLHTIAELTKYAIQKGITPLH